MGSSAATRRDYCLRGDGRAQKLRKASGTPSLVNLFTATSAVGPGCVKTRLSQGRAELFSQLPSPNRSCQCNRFSPTTKSRQKSTVQVQRRSFHTAWVINGPDGPKFDFRFTPESGLKSDIGPCPGCANMRLMHRSKQHFYSITSSACASSVGGTVRPSVFAVLRFMTSSNLVACSTGRSLGLAPLRILST